MPATSTPFTKNFVLGEHSASKEVEEARRMIEAGEYSQVIPRLLHTMSKYPDCPSALAARYFLGIAYYKIESYKDAVDAFNEYLALSPKGKYADESRQYVDRIGQEYKKKFLTAEDIDQRIRALNETLKAEPDKFEARWELADLLWKRGNFAESGRLYREIIGKYPEYAQDATVLSRIELLPNGGYIVLTPTEVMRRHVEEQPIEIVNVHSFRSGQDLFTRTSRYYVVTGQVYNQSDSVLYGVQVIVTIYGFGNVVYDTNTFNIGRLNPKETRAFSVQFSNFENIENINRHECVATFQR